MTITDSINQKKSKCLFLFYLIRSTSTGADPEIADREKDRYKEWYKNIYKKF